MYHKTLNNLKFEKKMSKIYFYTESQFYVDGKSFLQETATIVNNLSRDNKYSYGYDLLKHIKEFIVDFSISFKEVDFNKKLKIN